MAHPHKDYDPNGPIKQLREICLALPETIEKEAWGECTFRVAGKMFAMTDNNHQATAGLRCGVRRRRWFRKSWWARIQRVFSSRPTSVTRDGSVCGSMSKSIGTS